jgi:DNA-directed RNA polymerase subunit RPC12/RpoP
MNEDEYRCARCKKVFKKALSDTEAENQLGKEFGDEFITEDCDLVCDDCFKEMFG